MYVSLRDVAHTVTCVLSFNIDVPVFVANGRHDATGDGLEAEESGLRPHDVLRDPLQIPTIY